MASFHDLYDSCFKNASLLKIPAGNSTNTATKNSTAAPNSNGHSALNPGEFVTTLHNVMTSSKVVGFYIMTSYSPQCLAFTEALKQLHRVKTAGSSVVPQSSPPKIRRFFGLRRKSKKKVPVPLNADPTPLSIVVVCLDPVGADTPLTALGDAGWFALAPESTRTKVGRASFIWPPVV